MSAYRYVVFPRGVQPTAAEVRQLDEFAGLLANHYAWGVVRDDGRLALAAEQAAFDHARHVDAEFDALIHAWERHGCEVLDRLKFVKNADALRPVAARISRPTPAARTMPEKASSSTAAPIGDPLHAEARLAARQLLAHEAVAQSLLGRDRTLARYAAFARFASAVPYALIALAVAGTIVAGLYIRHRVAESGRESRQRAIERLVESPADNVALEAQDE